MQSLGSQLDPFLMKAINVTGDTTTPSTTDPTHATAMAETRLMTFFVGGINRRPDHRVLERQTPFPLNAPS